MIGPAYFICLSSPTSPGRGPPARLRVQLFDRLEEAARSYRDRPRHRAEYVARAPISHGPRLLRRRGRQAARLAGRVGLTHDCVDRRHDLGMVDVAGMAEVAR